MTVTDLRLGVSTQCTTASPLGPKILYCIKLAITFLLSSLPSLLPYHHQYTISPSQSSSTISLNILLYHIITVPSAPQPHRQRTSHIPFILWRTGGTHHPLFNDEAFSQFLSLNPPAFAPTATTTTTSIVAPSSPSFVSPPSSAASAVLVQFLSKGIHVFGDQWWWWLDDWLIDCDD